MIIYEPRGRAREYAAWAANLYHGCTHGCRYCYAPACLHVSPGEFQAAVAARPGVLEQLRKEASKHRGNVEPAQALRLIDELHPIVDFWKVGKLNRHPLAKEIDWAAFLRDVTQTLTRVGAKHYLKRDLLRCAAAGSGAV